MSRTKGAHGCCVLFYICPLEISPHCVSPKQTNKKKKQETPIIDFFFYQRRDRY